MARTILSVFLVLGYPALAMAAGGGHHDGPLTLASVLHNPEFWIAVFNFGLLVFVLVKFSKQPMAKLLEERRQEVEQQMTEAAAMKEKADALLSEYTDRMKTMDAELEKLRSDIAAAAEEDKRKLLAQAEENAARMKRETEELVQIQAEQLERSVKREVVKAAVAAAEQQLREALTSEDQRRLADDFQQHVRARGQS